MTESEAREKWCPMARQRNDNETCLGSNCALWQWDENEYKCVKCSAVFGYRLECPRCKIPCEAIYQGHCGLGRG